MIILDMDGFVAVECHQPCRADIYRIRTECHRLCCVHTVPDTACNNKLHFAVQSEVFERCACLTYRGERRNPGMLLTDFGGCAGPTFHAVYDNNISTRLCRQLHVVEHTGCSHLHEDWYLPVGCLSQFFDLDDHVVGTEEVGVPCRATLIDTEGQIPLLRNRI